ncbi:MAG: hypothetical protein AABW80_03380 [Nanoarchaeota archaeon]
MESFLKKTLEGKEDEESHRYFVRFGKGNYGRRFLISYNKGKNIKIKGSFEWVSDFARFVNELTEVKFTGKIMSKDNIAGRDGRKKGSSYVYEVSQVSLLDYPNAYCYLLDAEMEGIKLKTKKALPKPGKNAEKVDGGFCVMELDAKYWQKAREAFFWDVNEGKKCLIEHTLIVEQIEIPKNEKDLVKVRENAIRVGKIIRKINIDGKNIDKEYKVRA